MSLKCHKNVVLLYINIQYNKNSKIVTKQKSDTGPRRTDVLNVCSFIIFERMYIMNDKAKYLEVNEEKQQKIDSIREMFSKMYDFIEENCKSSRETSLAITKLEEAQFWAIKGITRNQVLTDTRYVDINIKKSKSESAYSILIYCSELFQ